MGEREFLVRDKQASIYFCCPPKLKAEWVQAETALGEYNTLTASLMQYMNSRIDKYKGAANHV